MENLWPKDLTVAETKGRPVAILKEQASLLGETTQNILIARVEVIGQYPDGRDICLEYSFNILAPVLNYRYKLFRVRHGLDLYPVLIYPDEGITEELYQFFSEFWTKSEKERNQDFLVAKSENEFIEILKAIFHSKRTEKLIQALIAQSTDYSSK